MEKRREEKESRVFDEDSLGKCLKSGTWKSQPRKTF